jgi:hypothetical protein
MRHSALTLSCSISGSNWIPAASGSPVHQQQSSARLTLDSIRWHHRWQQSRSGFSLNLAPSFRSRVLSCFASLITTCTLRQNVWM